MKFSLPMDIIAIASLSGFFLLFIAFGMIRFNKKTHERYSFFAHFPFEMLDGKKDGLSLPTYIAMGGFFLSSLFLGFMLIYPYLGAKNGLFLFSLLLLTIYLIKDILLFFILVLPARYSKAHVALVASYLSTLSLFICLSGFFYIRFYKDHHASMIIGFIFFALGILLLLFMLSKGFSDWARLSIEKGKDGEVIASRPSFFLLAFAEWVAIFVQVVGSILSILTIIILFG